MAAKIRYLKNVWFLLGHPVYILLDTVLARMLINILWLSLGANKDGGPIWGTGSIFSCEAKDCGIVVY